MTHKAKKIVIITEKLICDPVVTIIEELGATGYTIVSAGGKGSRGIRRGNERAAVIDDFANVKIEVIVSDEKTAQNIIQKIADTYFENYSGITYIEDVEILRPQKF